MEDLGGLQKVLVECTSMGTSGNEPRPLAVEDREFLNNALAEFTEATKPARHPFLDHFDILKDLWTVENTEFTPTHFDSITYLQNETEASDKADGFINLGGVDVCYNLLASTKETLLIHTCEILANISQNNELFAKHPKCYPILKYLLVKLKIQTGLSDEVKAKLIYAANTITSANREVLQKMVSDEHVGLKEMLEILLKTDDLGIATRLSRLVGRYLELRYDLPLVIQFTKLLLKGWIKDIKEGRRLYRGVEVEELKFVYTKMNFVYKEIWCRGFALKDSGFSHINIIDDLREFYRIFSRKFFPEICTAPEKDICIKMMRLQKRFVAKVNAVEDPAQYLNDEGEQGPSSSQSVVGE